MVDIQFERETDDEPQYENGDAPPADDGASPFRIEDILDAPDYSVLISGRRNTAIARQYRTKSNALLKSLFAGAWNANNYPDAAAILKHGPAFSQAIGDLADREPSARAKIDILMSPGNPYVTVALALIPLVAQVARNHETQLEQIPKTWRERRAERKLRKEQGAETARKPPTFTMKIGKRRVPVHLHVPKPKFLKAFVASSAPPENLTAEVFTDPKVQAAMQRIGIWPSATSK
jgi:hypothetical protein